MGTATANRVAKHRDSLRAAGLRPVQIWVPDTRAPGFATECKRQSQIVAAADAHDGELAGLMNSALADVDGWTA